MTLQEMQERKKTLGLSYEMISQLSGVPLGTVQKVLGGITKSPRYETLAALERVLRRGQPAADRVCETPAYMNYGSTAGSLSGQGDYTLKDYYRLPEDQRFELIDGVLYGMSAPSLTHQELIGDIYLQIRQFIKGKKGNCRVLLSPVDVQLDRDDRTMVQPDLIVVCDPKKTENGKHVTGAPDLVVEVLSDSTARRDLTIKLYKYRAAGVREYWVVDSETEHVTVHRMAEGMMEMYTFADAIPVGIYDGECHIILGE